MTDDVDGAIAFYGELFGWAFADQGDDFGHYRLIRQGDTLVGGLMSTLMGPDGPTSEPTAPTTWNVYLHTDDLAATLEQVPGAGGQITFGPMDVADRVGRRSSSTRPALTSGCGSRTGWPASTSRMLPALRSGSNR